MLFSPSYTFSWTNLGAHAGQENTTTQSNDSHASHSFLFSLPFFFCDRVSIRSPQTLNPPASASAELKLRACSTKFKSLTYFIISLFILKGLQLLEDFLLGINVFFPDIIYCICVCRITCDTLFMLRSEDILQELFLSFSHEGSGEWTPAIRLSSRWLNKLATLQALQLPLTLIHRIIAIISYSRKGIYSWRVCRS